MYTHCRPNEAYFITPIAPTIKERNTDGSRTIITTSGYWKASEEEVPVHNMLRRFVGYKREFAFYQGIEPAGEMTPWRMVEYRANPDVFPANIRNHKVVKSRVRRNHPTMA